MKKKMNVLIDILHPAHVHFFRGYLESAEKRGHRVVITTRNKEITNALLDRMGFPYIHVSTPARGLIPMGMELVLRWWKIYRLMRKHGIQAAMSIAGLSTALPTRLLGIPNITFSDTEDARLSNRIAYPFSDLIVTPEFYLDGLGKKHRRYRGLQELSYLKYFDLPGAAERVRSMGLPPKYVIIRLVAKDALHDAGISGIPLSELGALIRKVEPMGRVYITSQAELPPEFRDYRLDVPIEDVHAVLAGAALFIGESPTMAVESSVLGTPAFLLSSRWPELGNMVRLEKDHCLLRNFSEYGELLAAVDNIEDPVKLKECWGERAGRFRESATDMGPFLERLAVGAVDGRRRHGAGG